MSGIIGDSGTRSGIVGQTELSYETGTWTCTFNNTNEVTGYYQRIGGQCWISAKLSTSSAGVSGATFGGLPFTVGATQSHRGGGAAFYNEIETAHTVCFAPTATANSGNLILGNGVIELAASEIIYIQAWYFIA
jgi:hypothetical protein